MTHLRQRMLDELQRRNYSPNTVRSYIHAMEEFAKYFHRSPDQLGQDHVRDYLGSPVPRSQALTTHHRRAGCRAAVPIRQDTPATLLARRDSVPEASQAPAYGTQSGGSGATDRLHRQPDASRHGHDAVCDPSSPGRAMSPEGGRYRQRTHDASRPAGQGRSRPRRPLEP